MRILGYDYQIVRDGTMDDMGGAMGRCHYARLRIQIAEDCAPQQEASTLLHEILEALNAHMDLHLEHTAIMGLESGLYQVLRDAGVDLSPLTRQISELRVVPWCEMAGVSP